MLIKKAVFKISVAEEKSIPDYGLPEIAIAGKSNVGKSSFINFMCNRKGLAHTSAEPGRTRLLNYFLINDDFYFVDLPGYGFARVSDAEKTKWATLIQSYLLNGKNLKKVFVLIDSRRDVGEHDRQLVDFLYHYSIPFKVILTKCDKLTNNERRKQLNLIASSLKLGVSDLIMTSSSREEGREAVEKVIFETLS